MTRKELDWDFEIIEVTNKSNQPRNIKILEL